jgi:hypothetical protein
MNEQAVLRVRALDSSKLVQNFRIVKSPEQGAQPEMRVREQKAARPATPKVNMLMLQHRRQEQREVEVQKQVLVI